MTHEPITVAPREDLTWLSWLRVVAICFVVTIHTVGHDAIAPDARETLRGQLAIFLDIAGSFAVPVFVMGSGALLLDPRRYPGDGPFLRKRVARLAPAIVFWHLWYWALIEFYLDRDLTFGEFLADSLNGELYSALYFFWIVIGLAVVSPVLVPFLTGASRRKAIIAGGLALGMTTLTLATMRLRGSSVAFADNAFTWWVPYLGFFILGWALRGVVLRSWALALVALGTAGLTAVLPWQWKNPEGWTWWATYVPASYYSLSVALQAIGIYLVFQALIRPGGLLGFLTGPRIARIARSLGDATLGVFALHLTVLLAVREWGGLGSEPASDRASFMLARLAVVIVVTYVLVLVLRKVPVVRRLL